MATFEMARVSFPTCALDRSSHLNDFLFGPKAKFAALPKWKREAMKKEKKLF
jgi:hypothetical protein